ncbi:meiotic recombination protein SPO11-1 isoform X1 [Arachis stenosperma]|uniref:meiotic recombination protein SPO11-1 isoform X1 n=1 Tax=Arachis stenosperma TaxID=217475 RepID=UPI0025AD35EC|nr:meiotic recombination protein SPO11-1 isoform X1 [Arachis stenosperma]
MEGKWMSSQSQSPNFHVLAKIKEFTRSIVTDLSNGQSPVILIHRFRNHCTNPNSNCFCGSNLPCGKDVLTLCRESHVHRIDVMLKVLLIVQKLLQENRHCSKRDIYYMHPSVFSDQSVVDHAINDICVLMQCSRHNLNVVSAGKGLVMGWIRFFEGKRLFDCISSPNKVHPIPVHVEEVKDIISVAHYILVVEKESVFERLANDQFCSANHCIVITGRGYPDIPTRRFLRLLVEDLHLPAYCLVDCDPYGFDILTTYRFGSMQMAYDTKHLRVPEIQWLGAYPSDAERYFIPKQCLLSLTAEDKRKLEAMLLRCYLQRDVPQWRLELKMMLEKGVKFEIEALSVHALSFLSMSYLPSKIQVQVRIFFGLIHSSYRTGLIRGSGSVWNLWAHVNS